MNILNKNIINKNFLILLAIGIVLLTGCSVKSYDSSSNSALNKKIYNLAVDLSALSPKVDSQEAFYIAKTSVEYSMVLAKKYDLVWPPYAHNALINKGKRDRGFCYHWAEDLSVKLKEKELKTFDLRWIYSNKGESNEHNCIVAVPKGMDVKSGILLDPWRNSSDLYWVRVGNDPDFVWTEDPRRSSVFGTVKSFEKQKK